MAPKVYRLDPRALDTTHACTQCMQHLIYDIFDTANATRIRDLRDLNV